MHTQPFFAVRVVVYHDDGSTSQRDYVRGARHMGRSTFASWALGDMLRLVTGDTLGTTSPVRFDIVEVDFVTVQQNRIYGHTTHAE